ncbi:MAG: hypothetical protein VXW65_05975 [Pseudomonadota bacterium]|nr:hypothetical protein [Pseudomonadota bacterium]
MSSIEQLSEAEIEEVSGGFFLGSISSSPSPTLTQIAQQVSPFVVAGLKLVSPILIPIINDPNVQKYALQPLEKLLWRFFPPTT